MSLSNRKELLCGRPCELSAVEPKCFLSTEELSTENCPPLLVVTFGGLPKAGLFSTAIHLENRTSIIRKNCQPKHCTPACGKPLLADGVLSSVSSCTIFLYMLKTVKILVCCWLCVGKKIKHRRVGRKK